MDGWQAVGLICKKHEFDLKLIADVIGYIY
jgi:hypothetical protein